MIRRLFPSLEDAASRFRSAPSCAPPDPQARRGANALGTAGCAATTWSSRRGRLCERGRGRGARGGARRRRRRVRISVQGTTGGASARFRQRGRGDARRRQQRARHRSDRAARDDQNSPWNSATTSTRRRCRRRRPPRRQGAVQPLRPDAARAAINLRDLSLLDPHRPPSDGSDVLSSVSGRRSCCLHPPEGEAPRRREPREVRLRSWSGCGVDVLLGRARRSFNGGARMLWMRSRSGVRVDGADGPITCDW